MLVFSSVFTEFYNGAHFVAYRQRHDDGVVCAVEGGSGFAFISLFLNNLLRPDLSVLCVFFQASASVRICLLFQ